ncbi:MAG: DUF2953 domain-containing protein [Clostridia bacterium]|nr:DUF2953 domain-containing protein [Clostridia bacterium]
MSAGYIVLTVFGSLLLLILLILFSHVRLRVFFNEKGSGFRLSWFFIRKKMKIEDATRLIEGHTKEEKTEDDKEKEIEPTEESTEKKVPIVWQIERITRLIQRIADRLPGTLTLRTRRIVVTISTDDAAKTALLYGAVSAAMSGLIEFVDRSVARVKCRGRDDVEVKADFVGGKTKADLDLVLSAQVIGALRILFVFLTSGNGKKKGKHKKKKPKNNGAIAKE